MTGLSGLDTETLVTQMMKAESMKLTKLKKTRQSTAWRQESYRAATKSLKDFQSSFLSMTSAAANNFKSSANYSNITASVAGLGSDKTGAKISLTPDGTAAGGKYDISVVSIASKDVFKSAAQARGSVSGTGVFEASAVGADESVTVSLDGAAKKITFSAADIAAIAGDEDAFVAAFNQKLEAAFGTENGAAKVSLARDGQSLSLTALIGHTAVVSNGTEGTLADLGFTAGSSTAVRTGDSLETVLGVTGTIDFTINGKQFTFDKTDSLDSLLSKVNAEAAGAKMSFDSLSGRFTLESSETGAANAVSYSGNFLTNTLGLAQTSAAADAQLTINGVSTTRMSNDFTVDGLRVSLMEGSAGESYTVEFKRDAAKTVDFVKKFVEEYNKLVDTLKGYYNTPRPKSDSYTYYEPLSDDEKEALSEDEIKNWESKAKEGLLYNDSIMRGIAGQMRQMLYESVDLGGGKTASLYEFGITTTQAWNDGGKIQLDEGKLTQALETRADDFEKLFTKSSSVAYKVGANNPSRRATEGIAERLDDIIKDAVNVGGALYTKAGVEGSSAKSDLTNLLSAQDEKISQMTSYLRDRENYYYTMFSKLETAMNQANSQMSYLTSMLGQS
jgi:flagellar hook-associated protein 2